MAATIAGGAFNAIAFSLAGWAFSKIDKGHYQEEMKRHDQAMEDITNKENQWRNKRDLELDRLSHLRDERYNALKSERHTDDEFELYKQANQEYIQKKQQTLQKYDKTKPKFYNHYTPSQEFQRFIHLSKIVIITSILTPTGWVIYRVTT